MILLYFSPVAISNAIIATRNGEFEMNEDFVRHMVLNSLRGYQHQFRQKYGQMVICYDAVDGYWRTTLFPYYKKNRSFSKDSDFFDWEAFRTFMKMIKQEIREYMPYRVVETSRCEADDLIATIAPAANEKVLIISKDKDFAQLQGLGDIQQYSPTDKQWIACDDPTLFLREHIVKGDKVDGIPNIYSADDCIVKKVRQVVLNKQRYGEAMANPEKMPYYERNKQLIDLNEIPLHMKMAIKDDFDSAKPNPRSKMMTYFMEKRLKYLTEHMNEF